MNNRIRGVQKRRKSKGTDQEAKPKACHPPFPCLLYYALCSYARPRSRAEQYRLSEREPLHVNRYEVA
jgi:hypothetical protein